MTYLLDTNVLSELRKPVHRSNSNVRSWIAARNPFELHLSSITVLEVELGIARLRRKDDSQASPLGRWLEEVVLREFAGRILPVDVPTARRAARLHVPDPRPERDALIAATALVHGLYVVTRNTADFAPTGVQVINPWEPDSGA